MDLHAVLEHYAQLERRAMAFYRRLAERFAAHPAASRQWREMSNTEAGHFALLQLAQDWVAADRGEAGDPPVTAEGLDALSDRLGAIEAAGERSECSMAEAVALSVELEELELPRIAELAAHLPGTARGRVLAGIIGQAQEHYRMLGELVRAAGTPALQARVTALATRARAALG